MRIFCGLTNVDDVVAAAVVNERGGVIATAEVTDDPLGYAALCRMWIRYCELTAVSIADDGSTQALIELAANAGHPVAAIAPTPQSADDPLDTAIHIASALATGGLPAVPAASAAPHARQLLGSLHAMTSSDHACQLALIEVLRQCHPAALAAWDDPTDAVALELLCVVPDPADASEADPQRLADQLRDYAEPRRTSRMVTSLATAARSYKYQHDTGIAETVAAAAESVLSCQRATQALAGSLAKLRTSSGEPQTAPQPPDAPPAAPLPSRSAAPQAPEQPAPQEPPPAVRPPKPQRAKTSNKPPAEPLTLPLSMRPSPYDIPRSAAPEETPQPPRTDSSAGLSREPETPAQDASLPSGFPQMPEPPEFVEPVTTDIHQLDQHTGPDLLSAPGSDLPIEDADDDLLIFSQARSAWFKGPSAIGDDDTDAWSTPADEGWRAAAAVETSDAPAAETTGSGLPRRVPQANLVPGSAIFSDAPSVPVSRDAQALARHTAGYFRGWGRARRETVGSGSR